MRRAVVPESQILKPIDSATFNDSDDWPQFVLSQAQATSNDTGDPASLLFATNECPVTVKGRLERVHHGDHHYLRDRNVLPATVEINAQNFSYGQFDTGEVGIWAAGESGWFEIKPSRQYRPIYRDMTEAINILYFLADFYWQVKGKRRRTITVDTLLSQYTNEAEHNCPDTEHARMLFLKHRHVLLELMAQGKEDIPWKTTAIAAYLENEPLSSPEPEDGPQSTRPASSESVDENNPAARLAGKGKSSLRPKSHKHSNKGAGRNPGGSHTEMADAPRSGSSLKRKSVAESRYVPLSKRVDLDGQKDEGEDEEMEDASEEMTPAQNQEEPLPLNDRKFKAHLLSKKAALPSTKPSSTSPSLDIFTEPMPSFEPQGPGDTWTCCFDGCNHKVYGASTPESRGLIKEHYRSHAHECQAQIDLVQKEERPYLPVGNLVKKIREMATQQKVVKAPTENVEPWRVGQDGAVLEAQWPKPIKQKY